jgi:hypothetical protein
MDTKWVVGAAVAAFLAFGGATWWLTSETAAGSTPSPTAEVAKAKTGKGDAKARKAGGHAKAKGKAKAKGGKMKAGKGKAGARTGKAKSKARPSGADPAEAAAKWDAFRDIVAEGGHARVAEFGASHDWDAPKVASVQKLLDDGIAQLDGIAAQLGSGELAPDAAKEQVLAHRRDLMASLNTLVGEDEARELLLTMRPPKPGSQ